MKRSVIILSLLLGACGQSDSGGQLISFSDVSAEDASGTPADISSAAGESETDVSSRAMASDAIESIDGQQAHDARGQGLADAVLESDEDMWAVDASLDVAGDPAAADTASSVPDNDGASVVPDDVGDAIADGDSLSSTTTADVSGELQDAFGTGDVSETDALADGLDASEQIDEDPWYHLYTDLLSQGSSSAQGTLIVSHNAVAVFMLDLAEHEKTLEVTSTSTLYEAQTIDSCMGNENALAFLPSVTEDLGNGTVKLNVGHPMVTNIEGAGPPLFGDSSEVAEVTISMPYKVPQDDFERIPGTSCVGFHVPDDGWYFDFTPVEPVLDAEAEKGSAQYLMQGQTIDAVVILFDSTVAIEKVSYKVGVGDVEM